MCSFTTPAKTPSSNPFPVPCVHTTTMVLEPEDNPDSPKKSNEILGLELQQELPEGTTAATADSNPPPIVVASISSDSPFDGSAIQAGQTILSINGVAPVDIEHAAHLLSSKTNQKVEDVALTLTTCDPCLYPCTKMIVVPSNFTTHPGVSFSSTRGRCLVQVSRIFSKGPFAPISPPSSPRLLAADDDEDEDDYPDEEEDYDDLRNNNHNASSLRVGDVVLAVNGLAVAKPEDADVALRQSRRDGTYTTIYALDMASLRQACLNTAMKQGSSGSSKLKKKLSSRHNSIHAKTSITLSAAGSGSASSTNTATATTMVVMHDEKVCARLVCDAETQHISDPERFASLTLQEPHQLAGEEEDEDDQPAELLEYGKVHSKVILPFCRAFNKAVETRLTPLEEHVAGQSWMDLDELAMGGAAVGRRHGGGGGADEDELDIPVGKMVVTAAHHAIPVSTDSKSFAEMSC